MKGQAVLGSRSANYLERTGNGDGRLSARASCAQNAGADSQITGLGVIQPRLNSGSGMIQKAVTSIPEPIADGSEVVAVIRRHRDFVDLFRLMKDRLGLTNEFIDTAGGLTSGHADKLLGPSECRNFGVGIFDTFCTLFAVEFRVHVDLEAAQRMRRIWEQRKRPLLPPGKGARVSKELLSRARPFILKENCRLANEARNRILSSEDRSRIARKASRARWRKQRRRPPLCVPADTDIG